MPNGRMHKKPPKRLSNYKKHVKFAKGSELAKRDAELEKYRGKKGFKLLLQQTLEKWRDKVDPVDAAAILGLTVLIKSTIDGSEVLRSKVAQAAGGLEAGYRAYAESGGFFRKREPLPEGRRDIR